MSTAALLGGVGSALSGVAAVGSLFSGDNGASQARAFEHNAQLQKDFAQHGLRWRVEDAKRAGIHPLYALGAQVSGYSPSQYIPGDSRAGLPDLGAIGQNIGRAIDASRSSEERTVARQEALLLERGELENELLRSQIAREKAQLGPPLPMPGAVSHMPGQGDPERLGLTVGPATAHVQQKAQEVTPGHPANTSMEPQAVTDRGFVWTGSGYAPVPSKDAKDRMEDMAIPELMWSLRNNLLPNLGNTSMEPPAHLIPEGFNSWRWSYSKQEWQPHYNPHRARIPVQKGR